MLEKCDVIFQGGRIIDGSGKPGCIGDVAITGDSIVAIGDCDACSAEETVDVTGLVVAPGFIDVHTHDDTEPKRLHPWSRHGLSLRCPHPSRAKRYMIPTRYLRA